MVDMDIGPIRPWAIFDNGRFLWGRYVGLISIILYFSIQTTDNRTISNAFFVPVQLTENFLAYLWTSFFSWNFSGQQGE